MFLWRNKKKKRNTNTFWLKKVPYLIAPYKRGYQYNVFLISQRNIYCGCSLELPQWGASNEYHNIYFWGEVRKILTLKAPITTIVVCFVFCFCKQCGPRSDCSFRSSLIRVHTVCRYTKNRFETFARIFSRRHKQTTFSDALFLGALRVNTFQLWKVPYLEIWKKYLIWSYGSGTRVSHACINTYLPYIP